MIQYLLGVCSAVMGNNGPSNDHSRRAVLEEHADISHWRRTFDYGINTRPIDQSQPTQDQRIYGPLTIIQHPYDSRKTKRHHTPNITQREDYLALGPDVLERLWLFKQLGGTEKEFWKLLEAGQAHTDADPRNKLIAPSGRKPSQPDLSLRITQAA